MCFIKKFTGACPVVCIGLNTVEPRYNEVPRDRQNLFTITRFCYMEVLFHNILLLLGVKKIIPYTEAFII